MDFYNEDDALSPQIYTRVQKWISQHDLKADEDKKDEDREIVLTPSNLPTHMKKKGEYDDIKVEERTDVVKCDNASQDDLAELVKNLKDGTSLKKNDTPLVKPLSKYSKYNMKSVSAPPANFSVIVEGEESEPPPETKNRSEFSFKSMNPEPSVTNSQLSKRHVKIMATPRPSSAERKEIQRRTLERIGPSVLYSRWLLPLVEAVSVGVMLLLFDMYVNPEEYVEEPTTLLDYLWW